MSRFSILVLRHSPSPIPIHLHIHLHPPVSPVFHPIRSSPLPPVPTRHPYPHPPAPLRMFIHPSSIHPRSLSPHHPGTPASSNCCALAPCPRPNHPNYSHLTRVIRNDSRDRRLLVCANLLFEFRHFFTSNVNGERASSPGKYRHRRQRNFGV